jgi:glycosyltransferase involved in cell wall biosynthesis
MIKSICILTQSHLCRNPRVVKEANALAEAGFDVTIHTSYTSADLLEQDYELIDRSKINYRAIVNIIPGQSSRIASLRARLLKRLAVELVSRFRLQSPHALGYLFRKNFKAALKAKADLYICHQEAASVIGYKLLKKGKRVAFDFEDWYSKDLLPEANKYRPLALLEEMERYALNNSPLVYTTSESMAIAMAEFAGSRKPFVLNNVFPFAERDLMDKQLMDRKSTEKPSLHWFSQTIGPGRGLELLVESLSNVDTPLELHLRGRQSEAYSNELREKFPFHKGHELYFQELVPHKELLARIAEHDIGLAIEESNPPSRDLTITNKILQYLLAGIAVLASDTSGQKEVAAKAGEAVITYQNNDVNDLSEKINSLVKFREELKLKQSIALEYARDYYCWEKQKDSLVNWIKELK